MFDLMIFRHLGIDLTRMECKVERFVRQLEELGYRFNQNGM